MKKKTIGNIMLWLFLAGIAAAFVIYGGWKTLIPFALAAWLFAAIKLSIEGE